ncbi:hypothetical protein PPERSA_04505 [Pseudocohnilembus persalinus]|uniref:Tectonic-1-3 N-terminal domain-containing protein n=1 Tax=Pseudocohnilembus persalinus TaxID=266149 RepID=A0A0V0QT42_PSEPJ|nr:hypothetical protein PPERSA_04505 [Pseudocohnilembus persalinus]|eukprot:KRX05468.1 hypothetical protein PPERSA_04505 [Pseudocohnilembus persalinus]
MQFFQTFKNNFTYNQIFLNFLATDCTCDIMKDQCDQYCCCDGDCSGGLQALWDTQNKCIDLAYPSLLVIPECDDAQIYNIDDLFRTFRVAYNKINVPQRQQFKQ